MAYEPNAGKGGMFKNTKKKAGEKSPDYRGDFKTPDGTRYNVAAWISDKTDGLLSLSIEPYKERETVKHGQEMKNPVVISNEPAFDDEIPF